MKEAAGEANMTVVTIVLIAIVLGIGTLIVTRMMNGTSENPSQRCASAGMSYSSGTRDCVDMNGDHQPVPEG